MSQGLYRLLTGDDRAPETRELDDEARSNVPRNFVTYVLSHVLTKIGDALMNPKTTLTWVAGALSVPTWITGLLVPVREAGSMLLQVFLAGWVRGFRQRKWVWVGASVVEGASVVGMGLVALALDGRAAGFALLGLLVVFALARSLASVASKDVLGRTVPRSRRGRATGWAASVAGVATIATGAGFLLLSPDDLGLGGLAALLVVAGCAWLGGAALFARIVEPDAGGEAGGEALAGRFRLLAEDPVLRRFVVTRALLLCSALSAPYYVMLAQRESGNGLGLLMAFIVAGGVAAMLGGPVWGRMADRSSRMVMVVAAAASAALGLAVAGASWAQLPALGGAWALPAAYFLLSVAHEGVRVGRKTYLVDIAEGARRTDYVSVSNSSIGLVLLFVGGGGAALSALSVEAALLGLALAGLAGAVFGIGLPEAEGDEDD